MKLLHPLLRAKLGSDEGVALVTGSAGALVVRVGGTACMLLLQVLLARFMGLEEYGNYIYAFTWLAILSTVGCAGLDTSALRFVADYRARGEWGLLRGFLRRSAVLVLTPSALLALALVGVLTLFQERFSESLLRVFLVAAVLVPALALMLLLSSALRGLRKVVIALLPQSVLRPVLLGGGVFLVSVLFDGPPPAATVMGLDLMVVAVLAAGMAYALGRALPADVASAAPRFETRRWMSTALPLVVITGIRLAMNRLDILLIGVFLSTAMSGIYAAASQIASLLSFGLLAVNMIAAPLFSQLFAEGRMEDLQRIARQSAQGAFVFSLVMGAVVIAGGRLLLSLFGPEFVAGYPALTVLVVSQVVNAYAGSVGFLLSMTGHEREAARLTALAGLLGLALNALLIPILGLIGAALATGVAVAVWNLLLIWRAFERLGIRSVAFG